MCTLLHMQLVALNALTSMLRSSSAVVVGIIWQICVLNMGRPAGQALHEFVEAAVDAFMAGFTFDKLSLQLAVNVPNVLPLSCPAGLFPHSAIYFLASILLDILLVIMLTNQKLGTQTSCSGFPIVQRTSWGCDVKPCWNHLIILKQIVIPKQTLQVIS